jgi:hypothetical protein
VIITGSIPARSHPLDRREGEGQRGRVHRERLRLERTADDDHVQHHSGRNDRPRARERHAPLRLVDFRLLLLEPLSLVGVADRVAEVAQRVLHGHLADAVVVRDADLLVREAHVDVFDPLGPLVRLADARAERPGHPPDVELRLSRGHSCRTWCGTR